MSIWHHTAVPTLAAFGDATPVSHPFAERLAVKAADLRAEHAIKVGEHTARMHALKEDRLAASHFLDLVQIPNRSDGRIASKTKTYTPVAGAFTPVQLQTAYGTSTLGAGNEGQGTTIAIIDELNDTSIISDANVYSAEYGLPQFNTNGGPTMTVVNDTTLGSVGSAKGSGVGDETSLDVELAHAMAPLANILLVQVPATGTVGNEFKELLQGAQFAATQSVGGAPVVDVSMSYGYAESSIGNSTVVSLNSTYVATGALTSVPLDVSTGDGSSPLFPATSPNVIAVGGTSLYLTTGNAYNYETAWGGRAGAGAGGGGPSSNFSAPTFQSSNGVTLSTKRTIPDVSLVADPYTAVSVYDSFDESSNGGDPWTAFGGTSVATPVFSGILDLAQQNRLGASKAILSQSQIETAIYTAYNNPTEYALLFHDITLGNNSDVSSRGKVTVTGYSATTGYDQATGLGSPIATNLVPYLSGL